MKRILTAALLLAGATACGGGNNIKQFVLGQTNNQTVAGTGECPVIDPKVKTVEFNSDQTVTIFEGQKDKWYLDRGTGETIEGTFANGTYTFSGSSLVDTFFPDLNNKVIETKDANTVQVTLKVDGNTVTGTVTREEKKTCDNLTAANTCKAQNLPTRSGNTYDCITTGTLSGIQLDDPQYKYQTTTPGT